MFGLHFIINAESANCIVNISYNDLDNGGTKMAELNFVGLDNTSCNLSVNATGTTDQCLIDIEIVNNSKQICFNVTQKAMIYTNKQVAYLIGPVFHRLLHLQ